MAADWTVRPATVDDADRLAEIQVASIRAFGPDAYDPEQVDAWASFPDPDGYDLADPARPFVVADTDDEVVGFAQLDLSASELDKLYVHPDHASRGVGSRLLTHVEGRACEGGVETLHVVASRNAVPFYERHGYRSLDEHEKSLDGVPFTCRNMTKEL